MAVATVCIMASNVGASSSQVCFTRQVDAGQGYPGVYVYGAKTATGGGTGEAFIERNERKQRKTGYYGQPCGLFE